MLSIAGFSKRAHQRRAKSMGDASPEERENLDALHSVADDAGSGPVIPLATLRALETTIGVNVQDVLEEYTDQHASASDLSASPTAADFDAACGASQKDRVVDLRSVPLDGLLDALALREEAEAEGGVAGAAAPGSESPFSSFGRVRSPMLSDDGQDFTTPRDMADATDKDEERAFLRTVQSFARTSRTVTARRESLHFSTFGLDESPEEGSVEALQQRLGEIMDDAAVATEHRRDATDAFCLGQLHLHRATAADRLARAAVRRRFTLGGSTTPQRADLSGFGGSRSARGAYDDLVESTPTPRVPADRSIATVHGVLPSQVVVGTRVMPATLQHFHLEHASRAATPSNRRSGSRGSRPPSRALSVMEPSSRTQASVRRHMLNVSAGRSQKTAHYAPSPPRSMQPAASPSPKSLASPSPRPPQSKHATPFARVALCPTSHSPAATCVRRYWQEAVSQDGTRPSLPASSAQERTPVSAR